MKLQSSQCVFVLHIVITICIMYYFYVICLIRLTGVYVHCVSEKTIPFYFCNRPNFIIRKPIFIIFGENIANEIGNMKSLTCLLLTVRMSYS